MKKLRVGVIFGGKSTEHEVSLQSAKNVIEAMDKDKYDITLIGIDKEGNWYMCDQSHFLLNDNDPKNIMMRHTTTPVSLTLDNKMVDVVFPVLHGAYGEDGTVQGMLKLANIPFVGPSVLGSAIGMDKDVAKRLLRDAGIPVAKFLTYYSWEREKINFENAADCLELPLFIKPANLGSSVGINKVKDEKQFYAAIDEAFKYDSKILIEEFVEGQEVECAVLGNESPIASAVGEVISQKDFYSYEAKYIDEEGAVLKIPANIPSEMIEVIQELAVKTCKVLCCEGMARVDFFLTKENRVVINEINTIPGFTQISMYPKLWEISGISYVNLIDRLIELALQRFQREQQLSSSLK